MDRKSVEKEYGVELTDNQWRIIQAEIEDKEEWEDDDEIVEDVLDNLAYYEAEYAWWEDKVAQAQAAKKQGEQK